MRGVASGFHIHEIPVQPMLEFPCTGDAVGGHFNPWKVRVAKLDSILYNRTGFMIKCHVMYY